MTTDCFLANLDLANLTSLLHDYGPKLFFFRCCVDPRPRVVLEGQLSRDGAQPGGKLYRQRTLFECGGRQKLQRLPSVDVDIYHICCGKQNKKT